MILSMLKAKLKYAIKHVDFFFVNVYFYLPGRNKVYLPIYTLYIRFSTIYI